VSSDDRYWRIEIQFNCDKCNAAIPINGPLQQVRCDNCLSEAATDRHWKALIENMAGAHWVENGGVRCGMRDRYWFKQSEPYCPQCKAPFSPASMACGKDASWPCSNCGNTLSTFSAPNWLQTIEPSVVQVFSAERERASSAQSDQKSPVVLECPKCRAALTVTAESQRTTSCQYCEAAVYLPDGLWKTLHPVKIRSPWFIRIHGKTSYELKLEEQENLVLAEQEEERNRLRAERERERAEVEEEMQALQHETEVYTRQGWMAASIAIMIAIGNMILLFSRYGC